MLDFPMLRFLICFAILLGCDDKPQSPPENELAKPVVTQNQDWSEHHQDVANSLAECLPSLSKEFAVFSKFPKLDTETIDDTQMRGAVTDYLEAIGEQDLARLLNAKDNIKFAKKLLCPNRIEQ